ncbi:hypothetical protein CP880_09010 [Cutibacterium namnetense]|uniref:Uncharacterized protein n=1 Tax=Cutibacterium namnetense TaxID=1574624 RepID=A0ABX9IDJ9_9ACTN|nr:hypothetical protein CP880_09010 [Cutibacterium namnetense]
MSTPRHSPMGQIPDRPSPSSPVTFLTKNPTTPSPLSFPCKVGLRHGRDAHRERQHGRGRSTRRALLGGPDTALPSQLRDRS